MKEGEWLTAMEIFNYLQENTRDKLSVNKINWFGRILHKLNVPKRASIRGTLYHVVKVGIIYFIIEMSMRSMPSYSFYATIIK